MAMSKMSREKTSSVCMNCGAGLPAPEVQAAIHRVVAAFDRCDSNRGRFSCTPAHDGRCEKERGLSGSCTCGSDELEAAMAALAALDRKGT